MLVSDKTCVDPSPSLGNCHVTESIRVHSSPER